VTYAHKLDKAEARLDWAQDADALARTVRAFNPWPIAEATLAGERVRIHGAVALDLAHGQAPGGAGGQPRWHRHRLRPGRAAPAHAAARRRQGDHRRRLPQCPRDLRVGA
jgi:hypothetical protein